MTLFSLFTPLFTTFSLVDPAQSASEALQNLPQTDPNIILQNAINLILYLPGATAIIMVIYSGLQLTTSAGNPGAIARAKNTLIYSIVGLVIVVLAFSIVNFVIGKF